MYDPFVRAFNFALQEISKIAGVKGLPEFSSRNEIVFVCNHQRAVKSEGLQRNSRAKPDIALLQWEEFKSKIPPEERSGVSYSESYKGLCDSDSKWELCWREVRSTVEMKITGLPKPEQATTNFDADFGALEELSAYVELDDDPQPEVAHTLLPAAECKCTSF